MPIRRPLQIANGQAQQLQNGDGLDLGTNAPGLNTPCTALRAHYANTSWPLWVGAQYDAGQVAHYLCFAAEVTGGTTAAPTFTSQYGGAFLRFRDQALTLGTVSASDVATDVLTVHTDYVRLAKHVQGADGSAELPGYSFAGDTNTGMYRKSKNLLGFSTAGVERMTISDAAITFHLPTNIGNDGNAATKEYVQSRGVNLITNGNGFLGTNDNFSWAELSTEVNVNGNYSFLEQVRATYTSDEFVPVDPRKRYRYSLWAKTGNPDGTMYNAANRQSLGLGEYDADQQLIQSWMSSKYPGATDTTLAASLNPGDTSMTLTDGTGWYRGSNVYFRHFCWYPYTNSRGYTYPNYTYTRLGTPQYYDNVTPAIATNGVNGNVVTFVDGWRGPALPAGTPVRNCDTSFGAKYPLGSNITVPNQWTYYENVIGPQADTESYYRWRIGVAFVKPYFIFNHHNSLHDTAVRLSELCLTETDYTFQDLHDDGTAAAPAYSFEADRDTGIYRYSADTLSIAAGGGEQCRIAPTFFSVMPPLCASDGTASAPGYTFGNDGDTGLYRVADDQIGVTTGGVNRVTFENRGIALGVSEVGGTENVNTFTLGDVGTIPNARPADSCQLYYQKDAGKLVAWDSDFLLGPVAINDPAEFLVNKHFGYCRTNAADVTLPFTLGMHTPPSVVKGVAWTGSGVGDYIRFSTDDPLNGAGIECLNLFRLYHNIDWQIRLQVIGSTHKNQRIFVGLVAASGFRTSATPAMSYVGFRYDTTLDSGQKWRIVADNGSGAPTVIVTTLNVYNHIDRYRIVTSNAGWIKLYMNNVLAATLTPSTTPVMPDLATGGPLYGWTQWLGTYAATYKYFHFASAVWRHN